MQNNFNVVVDLKRRLPQEPIHLHKGDKGIPQIQVNVTSDGSDVTLTGLTATYSATIAGYTAVEDGSATISGSAVLIPVTENMTALPGLLLIDLKLTESSSKVVFTQTISAYVNPAVIDTGSYIDFSGITIAAALDSKFNKSDINTAMGDLSVRSTFSELESSIDFDNHATAYFVTRLEDNVYIDFKITFHAGTAYSYNYQDFVGLPDYCRINRSDFNIMSAERSSGKAVSLTMEGRWLRIAFSDKTFAEGETITGRVVLHRAPTVTLTASED